MVVAKKVRDDDSGLGLIELLVAMIVAGIVVIAAVSILVNSWLTQEDVQSTTKATNRGQLMGSAIERAMRNAKNFEVQPSGTTGTELRVWTTLGGDKECQGFTLTDGEARFITGTAAILPAVGTWPNWEDGVAQHGSTAFFSTSGESVYYTFDIETESAPVQISGEAAMRTTTFTGEDSPCW